MQKTFYFLALLGTIAVCLIPHPSFALGLEASAGFWWQDPSGDIKLDGGNSLDLDDDLGYNTERKPFGRIKLDLPGALPNIYLMATPLKFDETSTSNFSFTFGDRNFNGNVPFDSELKLDHYDFALFYSIPLLKTASLGFFNIDLGLNLRVIDFNVEVEQDRTNTSVSESFIIPLPMVYAGFQFNPIKRLSLETEVRGIGFRSNYYVDLIPRLKFKVVGPFFIAGGYRYQRIKIDYKDVEATVEFQGPFAEAGVSL